MEIQLPNAHDKEAQSCNSSSSSNYSNSNNNCATTPPLTPKSIPRTVDATPYPTTFIQADTSSFKQVVQQLTGSTETAGKQSFKLPPAKATAPKKPSFKLYERRSSLKNLKMISPLVPTHLNSSSGSPVLSPSVLDFPSLVLSPVTPLISDPFNRSPHPNSAAAVAAEDRAIAEKGFYLHPSPRGAEKPRLLPLFPVTSPKAAADSSA